MRTGPVGCGVAVVVKNGKQILLIKRRGAHGAGTWSVPGGWVEPEEGPERAARRELYEEVRLETVIDHLMFFGWTHTIHESDATEDICLWFRTELDLCLTTGPMIGDPEKIADMDWFPVWRLPVPLFAPLEAKLMKGAIL
jgi:ADP-ribose pyrophosphatase YjhB (NUDIX family)